MSSSTSSSEQAARAAKWTGFTGAFLGAAVLIAAAFLSAAFLIDPYDSGRSPLKLKEGVRPQGPRTALASRGRDQSFTGAIFGNSHIQLISPEELRTRTGIPFVSLIAPATMPKETFATIDWFLRHHRKTPPKAIVVGIDNYWCTANPALPNEKPFPFWLMSRSLPDYVGGLMRFDLLEELPRRVSYLTSHKAERARPDGYWDYESGYAVQGYGTNPEIIARLQKPLEAGGGNVDGPFPAATGLEELMQAAPAETALILLRPPVYVTALPKPGTRDAAADAACRKAFADLAARRPRTALIDWRLDRPELRDPNLFFDHSHYRQPIARLVEADIAEAIRKLN
ncbi:MULTISPECIES: hypothetical protein [Bosea]|uniref:hypothetical protein n=1 Tax=Bosea TaxID=85413 RepID=UPI00214F7830|nr:MULTISPECIES: hypothetical protein [Bosea]MCR4521107.1 hypothetical protein [Bosea sp. 47.2.35]MDR6831265.1 hypothetical protein [Bosea robiniae]MDR6898009.1 hypothetical protein [Bosea sp. BE109]MDR7141406.1 hypothetical protein [Bosea sp. BE168]MDR7178068.1 hypothetical protein [Bosea sp. BE271]